MCSMTLLCPLCAQTSFASIDALRHSLIKAANGPLACPICHELFLGLDKLTIHLFSHTSSMLAAEQQLAIVAAMPTTATTNPTAATATTTTTATTINELPTPTEKLAIQNVVSTPQPGKERRSKKSKQTKANEKLNQQQQQQPPALPQQQLSATCTDTLASCDICEFTFRNAQLRDMHIRLVHRNCNSVCSAAEDSTAQSSNAASSCDTNEPDFKCHLCSKRFKLKVHLKVHLKVVHLIGLSYVNILPKLSICDRIRHKELKAAKLQLAAQQTNAPPQVLSSAAAADAISSPFSNTVSASTFSIGTLTLLSPSFSAELAAGTITEGNMLNLNASAELLPATQQAGTLNSTNMLLVFNANAAAMSLQSDTTDCSRDSKDELSKSSSATDANPKIWECDVCAKSFTTKYFLKKHKRLHTGEMPYTCEICARTFTFQQSYHKHLLYHSDEKPHVCATCGRAFKELSTLHNHERIHSGEKPFKCEVCGKCFRQRVSFLVHTRIHTGIMPYKCEACQKCFRYKVSQRTHKCLLQLPDGTGKYEDEESAEGATETTDGLSEHFIKAFLESTTAELAASANQNSPASNEIAGINAVCVDGQEQLDEALLSKTIDDIVVESCHKMGIYSADGGSMSMLPSHNLHTPNMCAGFMGGDCNGGGGGGGCVSACVGDGSNSPLQKLQYMRIYSPQLGDEMQSTSGTGAGVGFPRFLLDETTSNQLL